MQLLSLLAGATTLSLASGNPTLQRSNSTHRSVKGVNYLGNADTPSLPKFIDEYGNNRVPWGSRDCSNTDPLDSPNTGVTRYYDWTLTAGTIDTDGYPIDDILLINGQFPGPTIEANWGDWIEIKVDNQFLDEGTSLHWHGINQQGTQWMDGVPGVTSCPIAPNSTFTYRFKADQYGTSWWHSHVSAQYLGGVHGAMIIHGPTVADYDIDLGPILIGEWFHHDYYTMVERIMVPRAVGNINTTDLQPQTVIINGKGDYNCSLLFQNSNQTCTSNEKLAKFRFQSGKKHLLRLVNTGASAYMKFSIDGHNMTVIAQDFVPIEKYTTNMLSIGIGQRYDVIVDGTGNPGDSVWMRSLVSPDCSLVVNHMAGFASIHYENASLSITPNTTTQVDYALIDECYTGDLDLGIPLYKMTPDPDPTLTIRFDILMKNNGSFNLWYINNSTYHADYNNPNLLQAKLGNNNFSAFDNIYNTGNHKSVRLVLYNYLVLSDHPMHLHGHNFYVLAQGIGEWNGTITNAENPIRRDTQILGQGQFNATTSQDTFFLGTPSYIVLQYEQDNPGVWPFHCHVAWHASDGFITNLLERPDEIKNNMPVPSTMVQQCREWSEWTGEHVVDEIDSGL